MVYIIALSAFQLGVQVVHCGMLAMPAKENTKPYTNLGVMHRHLMLLDFLL